MRDLKKPDPAITHYDYLDTPIGQFFMAGCKDYLRFLSFPEAPDGYEGHKPLEPFANWQKNSAVLTQTKQELTEYFAGKRTEFTVSIKLNGTDFQKSVWAALRDIPYGETRSYGDIAKAIKNDKASRAVGGANNANPIPVIVPCHRVIGADKSMTGFGGGIPTKEFLLKLEKADFAPRLL